MKLTTGISMLATRSVEKNLSKKILHANTSDKISNNSSVMQKSSASPSDPIFFQNSSNIAFNPDIRYNNTYGYSPLTNINYRNDLLIFAENNEVRKACGIITNETVVSQLKSNKYPLFPVINLSLIPEDKQEVAKAIQEYLDGVFYPKLFQYADFKKDGLWNTVNEFLKTGKLAYEIIYDNLKNPKNIIGLLPIDPSTLQKFKKDGFTYYVQRPIMDTGTTRIMHENQIILVEYNKYDYGYISYVDKLRRPFNIMRSMQTSKILWFACKSQVRLHVKLAMGDVSRTEAYQKLSQAKNDFSNSYVFDDTSGVVNFNGKPNTVGYREFFTAETAGSGAPEIEEINTNGPDLTEVDSLQYWEKYYWKETDIPYDRIDPNSSETWGFVDVAQVRKIELNFSKLIESNRVLIGEILLKPIIIQLTLQEIEIGIDLSLIDAIQIEWIAFNEYDKLGELELLNKKIEIVTNLVGFGEQEDVNGAVHKFIPISWAVENYLDYTPEQIISMDVARRKEQIKLGFGDGENIEPEEEEIVEDEFSEEEEPAQSGLDNDDSEFNFEDGDSVLGADEM